MFKNNKVILVFVLVLGCASCSNPSEEINEKTELETNEIQIDEPRFNDELIIPNSEIFFVFEQFKIETNARLVENTKNLKSISESYISEKNAANLAFQGELFVLNKKNSELRSRINNSLVNINNPVESDYEDFSKEMDLLELNIEELRNRNL